MTDLKAILNALRAAFFRQNGYYPDCWSKGRVRQESTEYASKSMIKIIDISHFENYK